MKTVIRYQSQLLTRRSYKPGRKVRVTFRPSPGGSVPLLSIGKQRVRLPPLKADSVNGELTCSTN
jgi:hypothetical protein